MTHTEKERERTFACGKSERETLRGRLATCLLRCKVACGEITSFMGKDHQVATIDDTQFIHFTSPVGLFLLLLMMSYWWALTYTEMIQLSCVCVALSGLDREKRNREIK